MRCCAVQHAELRCLYLPSLVFMLVGTNSNLCTIAILFLHHAPGNRTHDNNRKASICLMIVPAGTDAQQQQQKEGAPQPASAADIRSVVDRLHLQNRFAALAAHSAEAGDRAASHANGEGSQPLHHCCACWSQAPCMCLTCQGPCMCLTLGSCRPFSTELRLQGYARWARTRCWCRSGSDGG